MTLNKKVLAGLVAFAAASTSAQAVTLVAEDGWEVKVGGMINQFVTFSDNDNGDDNKTVSDGLLPAFLNFDFKAPTMNGLDLAAHISFSPGTNNTSGNAQEQREVYFTVDGSFGQVLAGKALGLYGSHNILTEQTLWGVGYGPADGGGSTSLGGIGLGYDYAAWRSQVKWTSNDMNGFKIAFAVAHAGDADARSLVGAQGTGSRLNNGNQPTSGLNGVTASEDFRYEADLSYAGAFDGGSYSAWLSGMSQDQDDLAEDKQAWTVGGTLVVGGFEAMAQYSDSEGASATEKLEWDQYVVQAGYRFNGTTLVSANYSELSDESSTRDRANEDAERITLGVYHDVNANLKLVAEYTQVESDNDDVLDVDLFSLGGFMFF
jgi:predicted porin